MLGEEERSSSEGSFSEASIPKRIAIVVARRFSKHYICFNYIFCFSFIYRKLYFK